VIGTRLGPSEITARLGAGGMGEVYRAKDSRLGRDVALEVLPEGFSQDPERMARFEREAKLLAQLNHPNIAQIYGLETSGPTRALVMELVEGPTLAERLRSGSLPLNECLSFARQIAEALEAAHEKGIIHRDLKPQNIKASIEGRVRVLDFGLAKALDPRPASALSASELAHSPTVTLGATVEGGLLGTAGYMSPEQAKGLSVDERADIWAFGCVLYEMLAGERLFAGDSVPETLAGVLKTEIDFAALPDETPPAIRRLLRRSLERNPKNRLHDIADARLVLEEVSRGEQEAPLAGAAAPAAPRLSKLLRLWPAALFVAAAAGLLAGRYLAPAKEAPLRAPLRLSMTLPPELEVLDADLSPDGSQLFFVARRRDDPEGERALYRRPIDSYDSALVPGTTGVQSVRFFSDGRWLCFRQPAPADPSSSRLLRMPVDGSAPPLELVAWNPAWSNWTLLQSGDTLVVIGGEKMLRLAGGTAPVGEPIPIESDRSGFFNPGESVPGDRGVLFNRNSWSADGWQTDSLLVDPASGKGTTLVGKGGNPRYAESGHLLFSRGPVLLGARFDLEAGRLLGSPVTLEGGLRVQEAWGSAGFGLARDGTLWFAPGGIVGDQRRLVVATPGESEAIAWIPERRAFNLPASDGQTVYVMLANARGFYDLWTVPRGAPAQPLVALADADLFSPVVSPDGRRLAFLRFGHSQDDGVYLVSPSQGGSPRLLRRVAAVGDAYFPVSLLPDGSRLLVDLQHEGRLSVLELPLDAGAEREPRLLVPAPARSGVVSPDGRWLAFASEVSGREEVYLAAYRSEGPLGPRQAVSRGGGPTRWSPDGRKLYFVDREHRLLAAAISSDGALVGEPALAADLRALRAFDDFQVLPDGRLLLVEKGELEESLRQVDLVVGFGEELARRIP
jgi:dipeptidyl aminopeptidase/acylaminoacyl peptidase